MKSPEKSGNFDTRGSPVALFVPEIEGVPWTSQLCEKKKKKDSDSRSLRLGYLIISNILYSYIAIYSNILYSYIIIYSNILYSYIARYSNILYSHIAIPYISIREAIALKNWYFMNNFTNRAGGSTGFHKTLFFSSKSKTNGEIGPKK